MNKDTSVAIVLKPAAVNDFLTVLPNLVEWLRRRKIEVFFVENDTERIAKIFKTTKQKYKFISRSDIYTKVSLIITLGGDGTLIGVARNSSNNSSPIFGINMGNLGFITEFSRNDFYEDIEKFFTNDYTARKIPLYKAEIFEKNEIVESAYFINDAVISKNGISRMFSITLESDNEVIYDLAGDGLIVSSPIGSTAYSLAAGGPIVHPNSKVLILTPICPHSLTHRPIILPDTENIWIKLSKGEENLSLTLDGQENITILKNQKVKISKSSKKGANLVINPKREYFDTLKEKFKHGRR